MENAFKSSVFGGFNREDVKAYLEKEARAHREEIAAYKAGAEALRRERDEVRAELKNLQEEGQSAEAAQIARVAAEQEAQRQAASVAELEARLTAQRQKEQTHAQELARLLEENQKMRDKLSEFEVAAAKLEEIEQYAYRRAETIENEALVNAQRSYENLRELIAHARKGFDEVRLQAESSVFQMMGELDNLRDSCSGLTDALEQVGDRLSELEVSARPEQPYAGDVAAGNGAGAT